MRHFVKTTLLGSALLSMVLPSAVFAKEGHGRSEVHMKAPSSVEIADRKAAQELNSNEHSHGVAKVNGVVKTISATEITITDSKNVDHTYSIASTTKMLRKFHGKASVTEIAVGDHVRVWAKKTTPTVAKMIWDRDIWAVQFPGTISNLDTTNKTFTLTIKWKMFDVTSTVKWDTTTVVKQGTTVKTAADLANGQSVRVSGSWNNIGKFIFAKTIKIAQ